MNTSGNRTNLCGHLHSYNFQTSWTNIEYFFEANEGPKDFRKKGEFITASKPCLRNNANMVHSLNDDIHGMNC